MHDLQAIQSAHYDLIVIGGGINGAGVVRDAAMRGLQAILIEKGDFGGGTTSWSTRLIHGGLRYLEYLEFPLVRESLREREILLRNAPHLVKPIQLTLPFYRNQSHKSWTIQAGMLLYDILSYDKSLPNHRILGTAQCKHLFPSLAPTDLLGAAQYYDAQAEYAERLCLEVIQSAAEVGATVLNYTEVTDVQQQNGCIDRVMCRDVLTGVEFGISVGPNTVVVNTAGPWLDRVCQLGTRSGQPQPLCDRRLLSGTKGSHIFVDPFPGAPSTALYAEAAQDGRPYFIVPWLGGFLIGTTDFRYEGDLDRVKADNDEIDYLIAATNAMLPAAQLTRESVRFTYSGVRPLPYRESKKAGAITRKHIILDHAKEGGIGNLLSLIGGKLTTHRSSSQEMVDEVYTKLGKATPPCNTAETPLPGAIDASDPAIAESLQRYGDRLSPLAIYHLFDLYGSQAPAVLALGDSTPELFEPIVKGLLDIKAQAVYAVQCEYARTLTDIANRRTALSVLDRYGCEAVKAIADVLVRHCSWDPQTCDAQIAQHYTYMEENCIPDYAEDILPEASRSLQPAG
ncbi:glycerol-3-phosphate dehydrogenase/oxidase [Synechococcus sp. PCC 7336]|uniref:glycerol-3-phosphate dehydrogenase/oxidase n=1 Tax=Synechococcus sp. PCC 7336 TaxID=195250 RepID=UPI0003481ACE|nr:glycerol-3-phosphate dehydrogenase/oxidase [Synechococcus sp. PCC 7336]